MKKYLYVLIISLSVTYSCKHANEKEIGAVDALAKILNGAENTLHQVDSNKLFTITKLVKEDIRKINANKDTLTRETAFKIDDYIGRTKSLYALADNYKKYQQKINKEQKQLRNLKQDLANNLIKKTDYAKFYKIEQQNVLYINDDVKSATRGIAKRIEKMINNRPAFLKMLKNPKSYMNHKEKKD